MKLFTLEPSGYRVQAASVAKEPAKFWVKIVKYSVFALEPWICAQVLSRMVIPISSGNPGDWMRIDELVLRSN